MLRDHNRILLGHAVAFRLQPYRLDGGGLRQHLGPFDRGRPKARCLHGNVVIGIGPVFIRAQTVF